ncbi:YqaE/Pmp3 family membrane protein [Sphingorhabdus sp. Alg239-R122]|uniref:YqaE/Pmp3 family membrane protein n=1 Tax=Sphingorhabdus sp. Alg239-R122 TaxID=2305989 RepID=UPI0013DA28A0|nr:YqaE/Pmp3 family membrane protein [Sphingorhabdus sp. Alg239-R122]
MIILKILLAIFLPPLGVAVNEGISQNFWICLLLTVLGYIPGVIFALYVLLAARTSI